MRMAELTLTSDIHHPDVRVFQPTRSYRFIGVIGLAFFGAMMVLGIWAPLANPDGSFAKPVPTSIIFGCFWGALTALAAFLLITYSRTRIFTSDHLVRVQGVFRNRTIVFSEVRRAKWRGRPQGGSLVLYGPVGRVVIEFAKFANGHELVAFFRNALPMELQERFEKFEMTSAPQSHAFIHRSDREQRIGLVVAPILLFALVGLAIWNPFGDETIYWRVGVMLAAYLLIWLKSSICWQRARRASESN